MLTYIIFAEPEWNATTHKITPPYLGRRRKDREQGRSSLEKDSLIWLSCTSYDYRPGNPESESWSCCEELQAWYFLSDQNNNPDHGLNKSQGKNGK